MKTISLTLFAALLVQTSAWSADCRDVLIEAKKEARFSRSIEKTLHTKKGVSAGTVTAVAAGIAVNETSASPGLVIGAFVAGGFVPAAVMSGTGLVKNIGYNKMIRLIDEAQEFKATDGKITGKILNRLFDRVEDTIDLPELAAAIVAGNESGALCNGKPMKFSHVDDAIRSGAIRFEAIEE